MIFSPVWVCRSGRLSFFTSHSSEGKKHSSKPSSTPDFLHNMCRNLKVNPSQSLHHLIAFNTNWGLINGDKRWLLACCIVVVIIQALLWNTSHKRCAYQWQLNIGHFAFLILWTSETKRNSCQHFVTPWFPLVWITNESLIDCCT